MSLIEQKKLEQAFCGTGIEPFYYNTVGSTNDVALGLAKSSGRGALLVAASCQTEGRGTRGRVFLSPPDSGIYMSLLLPLSAEMDESLALITPAAAVGVVTAIERQCDVRCGIKWVNDIYIGEKKLCGILSERKTAQNRPVCIIGIGVNVNAFTLPVGSDFAPAFLAQYGAVDCERLCADIASEIVKLLGALPAASFLGLYRERSILLGRPVAFSLNGAEYAGTALSIDEGARLIVDCGGESFALSSGDVSLKKPN